MVSKLRVEVTWRTGVKSQISEENESDVEAVRDFGYDESLVAHFVLKPEKISALANSVRKLADMEKSIGRVLKKTELADGPILDKISCPLGVLLIIFESRPEALVQIASLAIRSGNGLLLKGGKEARHSNAILHKVITGAIPDIVGDNLIRLLIIREEIPDLIKLDDVTELVIPRGSNKLVSDIKNATKIPVLGHSLVRTFVKEGRVYKSSTALLKYRISKINKVSASSGEKNNVELVFDDASSYGKWKRLVNREKCETCKNGIKYSYR